MIFGDESSSKIVLHALRSNKNRTENRKKNEVSDLTGKYVCIVDNKLNIEMIDSLLYVAFLVV